MNNIKKKYLHWKWQRRYNRAWRMSAWKAKMYHEDISMCSPYYYFEEELRGLKEK